MGRPLTTASPPLPGYTDYPFLAETAYGKDYIKA